MSEDDISAFDYQIKISPRELENRASGIRTEFLVGPVHSFVRSMENLRLTLVLPYSLLALGNVFYNALAKNSGVVCSRFLAGEFKTEADLQEAAFSLGEDAGQSMMKTGQLNIDFDQVQRTLDLFVSESAGKRSLIPLPRAAVVLSLAAYETLASDVWIASLNNRPTPFAVNVLNSQSVGQESSINRKTVQTWILYRYNFDLRNEMGTILRDKFKFTGVDGIYDAYVAAFGRQHKTEIKGITSSDDLNFLEAARHNIAHKAGIADQRFLSRVKKYPGFCVTEGDELVLSGTLVSRLISTVIESGFRIVEFVDQQVSGERPRSQPGC